jgi:hypothetical protein
MFLGVTKQRKPPMKATLEFDLNDCDDRVEHSLAIKGKDAHLALSQIQENLRQLIKYRPHLDVGGILQLSESTSISISESDCELIGHVLDLVRQSFWNALERYDIRLEGL